MSFASTALRQRERESKALRIFLACSLAGSLLFHLVLLASGIGKYLFNRVPSIEDEPLEITLLDTPIEEIEPEPNEVVKPKPKPEPKKIEPKLEKPEPKPEIKQPIIDTNKLLSELDTTPNQSRISGGSPALRQPRVTQVAPVLKPLPKPKFKPIKPLLPVLPSAPPLAAREKPVIPESKTEPKPESIPKNDVLSPIPQPEVRRSREFSTPVEPPLPIQNSSQELKDLLAQERDSRRTPREFSTTVTPPIEPPAPAAEPDEGLKDLLAQERDSRRTPRSFSNPIPAPVEPPAPVAKPDDGLKDLLARERDSRRGARSFFTPVEPLAPSAPDTSNIGGSSDNAPRRRRKSFRGNVAAAPTNTSDTGAGNGLGNGSGDSFGDGDGQAACRRCNRSYPSWARQRGIEGSITVSVDADARGNVTNVQLISGSGNSRLDKHHLRLARKWKLKPSSNGRQGVTIITRYQLQ
ncbi:MAG: TonB family protein [Cyanobacteria bacterium P01_D01_bin.50]